MRTMSLKATHLLHQGTAQNCPCEVTSAASGAPLQCPSGATFAKATVGYVDEAIDRRHQGRQVALVDPALGEPCGEDIDELDPSVDVAWFGRRHGNLYALLDDTNGPLVRRVVGLPTLVPARRRAPLRDVAAP